MQCYNVLLLPLVKPSDLVTSIKEALANDDNNKVDKLLSGAIKQLKNARLKVDNKLNEALSVIAVENSSIFDSNSVIEVVCAQGTRNIIVSPSGFDISIKERD